MLASTGLMSPAESVAMLPPSCESLRGGAGTYGIGTGEGTGESASPGGGGKGKIWADEDAGVPAALLPLLLGLGGVCWRRIWAKAELLTRPQNGLC